jgi:hypothetical protein
MPLIGHDGRVKGLCTISGLSIVGAWANGCVWSWQNHHGVVNNHLKTERERLAGLVSSSIPTILPATIRMSSCNTGPATSYTSPCLPTSYPGLQFGAGLANPLGGARNANSRLRLPSPTQGVGMPCLVAAEANIARHSSSVQLTSLTDRTTFPSSHQHGHDHKDRTRIITQADHVSVNRRT